MKKQIFIYLLSLFLLSAAVSAINATTTNYSISANIGYGARNSSGTTAFNISYSLVSQSVEDQYLTGRDAHLSMGFYNDSVPVTQYSSPTGRGTSSSGSSSSNNVVATPDSTGVDIFNAGSVSNKGVTTSSVGVSDKVIFTVYDETFTLEVSAVTTNSVTFSVSPELKDITLNLGESKTFDLNDDGFQETKIELKKIVSSKSSLQFSLLENVQPEPQPIIDGGAVVSIPEKSDNRVRNTILVIGALSVIVGVIIYYISFRGKVKRR